MRSRINGCDVFWSPRHHLPIALGGIPTVVTIHDLIWRTAPQTMERGRRFLEAALMRQAVRRADRIIAVSESTRNDLVAAFPSAQGKTTVIPLAASLPPASPASPVSRPYILFVGTMEPRKNLVRVIDAFAQLLASGDMSHDLLVAGNPGWRNSEERKRLRDPSLGARLKHVGHVDDDTLAQLYSGADFVVAPSLYEGFGLQVLEALSFGKPVITSNISSLPEVAGDAAILVDPFSVVQIRTAMQRLIEDRHLHQELSERASRWAARFSWRDTITKTVQVISAALGSPDSPTGSHDYGGR